MTHKMPKLTTSSRRTFTQTLGLLTLAACTSSSPAQHPTSSTEMASEMSSESAQATASSASSLDLYLLVGQSNMAGRAQFVDQGLAPLEGVSLLNNENQWEPAQNPLNQYSTVRKDMSMQRLGPGYSFAKAMRAQAPTQPVGLVVNARGGSAIAEWGADEKCYQDSLHRIVLAQEHGTLRGILWHQGETDHQDPAYLEKLTELIARFRKDLKRPQLPFVAGEINNIPALNAQLAQLPSAVAFTGLASADGLTATDEWHFDTHSILTLGERYAEQMQALQAL